MVLIVKNIIFTVPIILISSQSYSNYELYESKLNGIFFIYSKFIWKIIDIAILPNHFNLNSTIGITIQKLSILII